MPVVALPVSAPETEATKAATSAASLPSTIPAGIAPRPAATTERTWPAVSPESASAGPTPPSA